MLTIRNLILILLILYIIPSLSLSETLPPGEYDCSGRVVRKANGEFAIFWGRGCHSFPKKLQGQLQSYVGKFVKVEYTRIGDKAGVISIVGSVIGRIDKISVLANAPDTLPVMVVAKPTKNEFGPDEPISVSVSIINQSNLKQSIQLGSSHTVLCQDYKEKLVLEPEGHYYDKRPYGLPEASVLRTLEPGQNLEFTVTSQQMAKPGTYQLVYSLSMGARIFGSQSDIVEVIVRQPKNEQERKESLTAWLSMAIVGQRIDIAKQLLDLGDLSGRKEILRLLAAGEYSKPHYCNASAFRFAWQYGGKKGEAVMLALIKREKRQDYALRMIESIHLSPNRIELLQQLLTCGNSTHRDISGWIDEPRICDVTAAWLMGYTNGKMNFPKKGTETERDNAVASVLKVLKNNPTFFHVLSKSYK